MLSSEAWIGLSRASLRCFAFSSCCLAAAASRPPCKVTRCRAPPPNRRPSYVMAAAWLHAARCRTQASVATAVLDGHEAQGRRRFVVNISRHVVGQMRPRPDGGRARERDAAAADVEPALNGPCWTLPACPYARHLPYMPPMTADAFRLSSSCRSTVAPGRCARRSGETEPCRVRLS